MPIGLIATKTIFRGFKPFDLEHTCRLFQKSVALTKFHTCIYVFIADSHFYYQQCFHIVNTTSLAIVPFLSPLSLQTVVNRIKHRYIMHYIYKNILKCSNYTVGILLSTFMHYIYKNIRECSNYTVGILLSIFMHYIYKTF